MSRLSQNYFINSMQSNKIQAVFFTKFEKHLPKIYVTVPVIVKRHLQEQKLPIVFQDKRHCISNSV